MIKVFLCGGNGKMGQELQKSLKESDIIQIVGTSGRHDPLAECIRQTGPDVAVDFTRPETVYQNARTLLECGVHAVIGTTGITPAQRKDLDDLARQKNKGILIAPNFSIGVILMIRFAAEAAKYFHQAEIIEYHHDTKADAPSGTALQTAEKISAAAVMEPPKITDSEMLSTNSRGADLNNIRIHAVRLPGFVACQEVLLSSAGQVLKIRHDTIDRSSYIPGILMSIQKIVTRTGLVYGMENLMD